MAGENALLFFYLVEGKKSFLCSTATFTNYKYRITLMRHLPSANKQEKVPFLSCFSCPFFFFFTTHMHTTPSTRGAAFCCETVMERDLLEVVSLR